jgi:hypothetical protein
MSPRIFFSLPRALILKIEIITARCTAEPRAWCSGPGTVATWCTACARRNARKTSPASWPSQPSTVAGEPRRTRRRSCSTCSTPPPGIRLRRPRRRRLVRPRPRLKRDSSSPFRGRQVLLLSRSLPETEDT